MRNRNLFILSIAVLVMLFAVACKNETVLPKYTVSFDAAGGSEVKAITVDAGAKVSKPVDPTRAGYLLVDWYLGEDVYDFDTPVSSDITLKAVWGKAVGTEADLKAAIAEKASIVSLSDNISATDNIIIDNGVTMIIDLHGKNIDMGAKNICINAFGEGKGATLSIIGNGKISSTGVNFALRIVGTSTEDSTDKIYLSIGKDVVVEGNYAVSVLNDGINKACYDVTVDIYGTVKGLQPVYVSGNIYNTERAPIINICENAKVDGDETKTDPAIYIAGYSTLTIGKNAEVTNGKGNAVDIAAGRLYVNGAVLSGGNDLGFDVGSGGSISSNTASAVLIKQHSTNLPIDVVINSGRFSAFVPFIQEAGQKNPKPELVNIAIKGGEFACTSATSEKASVKSADKTGFITGGTFSEVPDSKYIANGYEAKKSGESWTIVKSAE